MGKKLINIDGWNPPVLKTGDRVICITRHKSGKEYLHTGIVGLGYNDPEEEEKRRKLNDNDGKEYQGWYVIDDLDGKKLYPYTQDTCLIAKGNNEVKYVKPIIVEV